MINQNKEINYSKIADKETQNLIWEKLNSEEDSGVSDIIQNANQTTLNTDTSSPLNHINWLNDYKTYGQFSYVYNEKTKLYELYEDLNLCANDKMISGEALDYHILNNNAGNFLSNSYGLGEEDKATLISLNSFDNIMNNDILSTLLNLPLTFYTLITSTEALDRMIKNDNAMIIISKHDESLNYIANNQTALNLIANSQVALNRIWESEKAVNAICASPIFFILMNNQEILKTYGYAASNNSSAYGVWNGLKTFIANGKAIACAYSGEIKNIILPNGTYTLKVYGAQGGSYSTSYVGGKGGYATGNISISSPSTYYLVVGGQGSKLTKTGTQAGGGYNGGGHATTTSSSYYTCGGGGASHIATASGTLKALGTSNLSKILIVAGGGGGCGPSSASVGGGGGGTSGVAGTDYSSSYYGGLGGTQTAAGTSYYGTSAATTTNSDLGGFGFGASAKTSSGYSAGGGGGLYGGGSARYGGGGGGSGYIGGVTGGSMTNANRAGNGNITITRVGA